eukprot:1159010-Pelagomonas_calceolata.AAC.12
MKTFPNSDKSQKQAECRRLAPPPTGAHRGGNLESLYKKNIIARKKVKRHKIPTSSLVESPAQKVPKRWSCGPTREEDLGDAAFLINKTVCKVCSRYLLFQIPDIHPQSSHSIYKGIDGPVSTRPSTKTKTVTRQLAHNSRASTSTNTATRQLANTQRQSQHQDQHSDQAACAHNSKASTRATTATRHLAHTTARPAPGPPQRHGTLRTQQQGQHQDQHSDQAPCAHNSEASTRANTVTRQLANTQQQGQHKNRHLSLA